jgi:hypothetical protein
MFKDVATDRQTYQTLARVIRNIEPELWEEDPTRALLVVMRRAVRGLPGDRCREDFPDGFTWRRVAEILYFGSELDPSLREYSEYTDRIASESEYRLPKGTGTFSRFTLEVREKLADKLLEMERKAIERREPSGATQDDSDQAESSLIERPEYIDAIRSMLETGHQIIYIWGEPGTGKTVLANQAVQVLCGSNVIQLRADDRWLGDDVARALIAEGMEPDSYARAKLQNLLGKHPSSDAVIIDNVDDVQLVWELLPDDPKIPVLITMRRQLCDARSAAVELHDFTEAQADHFIQQCLPHAPELERLALARVLGYRPLALEHAVLFAKEALDVGLSVLLRKLTANVTDTLPTITAPEDRERELVRLYDIILEVLLSDDAACDVLDSFLAVAGINGSEQRELVYAFMHSEVGGSHDRFYFRTGLRTLTRYGLLREIAEDDPDGAQALLTMHQLTVEILRGLRAAVVSDLNRGYVDLISSPDFSVPDDDEPGTIWLVLRAQAAYAVRDILLPGWRSFQAIDQATWQAVRELPDETGALTVQAVRYDVFPHGVFAFDYRTGKRSPVTGPGSRRILFHGYRVYPACHGVVALPGHGRAACRLGAAASAGAGGLCSALPELARACPQLHGSHIHEGAVQLGRGGPAP